MKIKEKLIALSMSSLIVLGSGVIISNANEVKEEVKMKKCIPAQRIKKGPHVMESTIRELKDSGVLNDEDVKNIENFRAQKRALKIEDVKNKKHAVVDDMVNQKVITKEKGEKLKVAIDKNIEARIKSIQRR